MNYQKVNRFWQSATLFLAPPLIVLLIWLRPIGFFTPLDWALSIVVGAAIVGYFGAKTRGRLARPQKSEAHAAS